MNKKQALPESKNRTKKFRKLGRTKPGVKEDHSRIRGMENKPVKSKLSPEPEGEEKM